MRCLVRATINALGARTTIGRDAAGRQTSVQDAPWRARHHRIPGQRPGAGTEQKK
jgi:uncharacterized protein RhaS with RHS repeats